MYEYFPLGNYSSWKGLFESKPKLKKKKIKFMLQQVEGENYFQH